MSTKTKRISELPEGTTLSGFYTIGAKLVSGAWNSIRVNLGFVQTAADNATAGAAAANTAADKAKTATANAETATSNANTATSKANTAAANADTATSKANTAAASVDEAKTAATEAAAKANTAAANADTATGKANTATTNANAATDRLTTLCDNRDKVVDGYWWHYNESTKTYENTGEIAKGNVMYATFEVTDAGRLLMHTDEEYTGANFKLDEQGVLSVII